MDPERTRLTAPERIYLGYTSFWYETSEEGLHDIEYVRTDLLTTTSDSARRAAEEIEIEFPQLPNYSADKVAAIISKHFTAAVVPVEKSSPIEGEQWRQGMRDAAKEICDACADEYRYGRARKIEGSTRWWHGEHADFQCEAGSIWRALAESPITAAAPADNEAELFVLTVPEIEELIQGHESASVQLAQAGKDYGHHLRRLELLRRMLATTTKGDR